VVSPYSSLTVQKSAPNISQLLPVKYLIASAVRKVINLLISK
jgi:hypothetical protein